MQETNGIVTEFDNLDLLGWITADDGTRIRFGLPALEDRKPPPVGTRVRVVGSTPGYKGVPKAVQVLVEGRARAVPDIASWLTALGLEGVAAGSDWQATHAALVDRFSRLPRSAEADRMRVCALPAGADDEEIVEAFLDAMGESVNDATGEDALVSVGERLRIREHVSAAASAPLLVSISGRAGELYLIRSAAEIDALPKQVSASLVCEPDTDAALDGIFRAGGATPAFIEHAVTCARCQRNLREVDASSLPPELRSALR